MRDKLIIFILSTLLTGMLCAQTKSPFLEGMANMQKANYDNAIEAFSTDESLSDRQVGIMHLNRGIAYFETGNTAKAESEFSKAVNYRATEAYFWMAKIHAKNKNISLCTQNLNQYYTDFDIFNNELTTKDDVFRPFYQTNEWQDFITGRGKSEAEVILDETKYYYKKEQFQEGINYLNEKLTKTVEPDILFLRAKFYFALQKYALAIFDVKKALEIDPLKNMYKELLADCYVKNNEPAKAITYYSEIISSESESFSVYIKLSKALVSNNNLEEAEKLINTYRIYFPNDLNAKYLLADINYQLGEYTSALRLLNKLIEVHTPQAEWFYKRGQCYLQTGTYKYAAEDLSMCLDLDPRNASANYDLGLAQIKLGNTNKACYYWERALRYGDDRASKQLLENCQ